MPLLYLRQRRGFRLSQWIGPALASLTIATAVGCAPSAPVVDATITVNGANPTPNAAATRDREVAAVYADAKSRDESALLALAVQLPAPTPTPSPVPIVSPTATAAPFGSPGITVASLPSATVLATSTPTPTPTPIPHYDPAIALGLYYVNPKTYADSFVASYPIGADGVMHDYGSRFVAAHVESSGALFPIRALASIAAGGDQRALARLYEAMPASQGSINTAYARAIAFASANDPSRAFAALALVAPAARLDVLDNAAWCGGKGKRMLGATTSTDFQAALKADLGDRLKTACRAATKKVRKPHGHPKPGKARNAKAVKAKKPG